jgi:hypothetical protein
MAPKRGHFAREERSLATISSQPQRRGLTEIWVVWLLFGLATAAVFETYWRIPPSQLWKVHNSGFVGGSGRALVFLGFSPALAAFAALPIVGDRLEDRRADLLAIAAFLLCATVGFVQTPSHLDPKWSNIWPVVGVALAVALTAWASLRGRREPVQTTRAGDRTRIVLAAVTLLSATPYVATALLLSRLLGGIRRPGVRPLTAAILALLLVYGWTNMVNDLWIEQVVKRGWTSWQVPDVLFPSFSLAWVAMLVAAVVVYAAFLSRQPLLGRR